MYSGIYEGEFKILRRARKKNYEFYFNFSANRAAQPLGEQTEKHGNSHCNARPLLHLSQELQNSPYSDMDVKQCHGFTW